MRSRIRESVSLVSVSTVRPSSMLPLTLVAGTAGLGIADGIRSALMISEGLTSEEARKRFWFVSPFRTLYLCSL